MNRLFGTHFLHCFRIFLDKTLNRTLGTGRKLNIHMTFKRLPGRLWTSYLVLCTFYVPCPGERGLSMVTSNNSEWKWLFKFNNQDTGTASMNVALGCWLGCFPTNRSSLPEVFCKKGVLINFAKVTEKHLCQNLSFKACVRYFLSSFYFSPNESPSKTMKNVFYFI